MNAALICRERILYDSRICELNCKIQDAVLVLRQRRNHPICRRVNEMVLILNDSVEAALRIARRNSISCIKTGGYHEEESCCENSEQQYDANNLVLRKHPEIRGWLLTALIFRFNFDEERGAGGVPFSYRGMPIWSLALAKRRKRRNSTSRISSVRYYQQQRR